MRQALVGNTFAGWREVARELLAEGVAPEDVLWSSVTQPSLLPASNRSGRPQERVSVPRDFIRLGEAVACYNDPGKWPLLYRILYRLVHENRDLLKIESDPDVREARVMEKAVRRDVHKFHAFVRFKRVSVEGVEVYTAWHEPQHFTVEMATPFFARRFGNMRFSILTPKGCAHWDLERLTFSTPVIRRSDDIADDAEEFWLTYYRSIFNPLRLKLKAMKNEMPVHYWSTMPETTLIPELVRNATKS